MKSLLLVGCLVVSTCGLQAQNETKAWTRIIGGPDWGDEALGVTTDLAGNIIVSGGTRSSLAGTNAGRYDLFVTKYDPAGKQLWLQQRGTKGRDFGEGVAADAAGNIYVTGYTSGPMDGNKATGDWDIILVKFDPQGKWLWTRQDGGSLKDEGHAVAVDAAGNVYITGYVSGGFHKHPRFGGPDVFISKYDSTGKWLWSDTFGSGNVEEGFGIACDKSGNVYVTGYSQGNVDPKKTPEPGAKNQGDNFLAKYDSAGKRLWLKEWGTGGKETAYAVATDPTGNVVVSGYTTRDLYGKPLGNRDAFVAKFDAEGKLIWGKQFGSAEHDQGWAVATDGSGNVFVAGGVGGFLDGNPSAGATDAYFCKFDPQGKRLATYQFGTDKGDWAKGITVGKDGSVYLIGLTTGNLAGNVITDKNRDDSFLVKYAAGKAK